MGATRRPIRVHLLALAPAEVAVAAAVAVAVVAVAVLVVVLVGNIVQVEVPGEACPSRRSTAHSINIHQVCVQSVDFTISRRFHDDFTISRFHTAWFTLPILFDVC